MMNLSGNGGVVRDGVHRMPAVWQIAVQKWDDFAKTAEGIAAVAKRPLTALLVACLGGCTIAHPKPNAFALAANPDGDFGSRLRAVDRLDGMELDRLRGVLISRIPGRVDETTVEDATILGQIGDEHTADELEGIKRTWNGANDWGQVNTAISLAAKSIRARLAQ